MDENLGFSRIGMGGTLRAVSASVNVQHAPLTGEQQHHSKIKIPRLDLCGSTICG
jgi:hypothetical protein